MDETRTIGLPRRAVSFAAAAGLALAGTITLVTAQTAQAQPDHKVWVCKYVDIPGEKERPLPGNDGLIYVDWHSLKGVTAEPKVGDAFSDAQVLSRVVQIGGDRPASSICEVTPTTTETTTSTGTETTTETTTSTGTETTTETTTSTGTETTSKSTSTPSTTPTSPTGGAGGGVTPGAAAPNTGGSGGSSPASTLLGSGLLIAAGGVLTNEAFRRRREVAARD